MSFGTFFTILFYPFYGKLSRYFVRFFIEENIRKTGKTDENDAVYRKE
jgi:hypothetical protein